jgi:hypothetical protein
MKKILVISPSGEVYDHDCVRWYNHTNIQASIDHYHNIGDAFVFDSSLKLLNFDVLEPLKIRTPTDADIDRYNAEYDYAFLRGSNYIHPTMDWEQAPRVLAKLKIPVIAFGVGAQAPKKGKLELSEATKRVLHLIADRSVSMGVRGSYTADVLWSLGIRNARIVGCPTVFRRNDPHLRIDLPALDRVKSAVFTLRREVGGDYAQDLARYLDLMRDTILDLARKFDLSVMAQGEIEEKKILWGTPEQKAAAIATLRHENWLRGEADPMEKLYDGKLFYSDVVAEIERHVSTRDLVLGYRLHGNLMALANKVPSVYFTYDSRTVEFAETFAIPSFDVFGTKQFRLEDYWDQALFEKFNRAYFQRYRDMRLFLTENGLDHKMTDETSAAQAARQAA